MQRRLDLSITVILVLLLSVVPLFSVRASTYTVNSTNDVNDGTCDGTHCSLREALLAANSSAGADTIQFNIPGCGGVCTITPNSNLPFLLDGETTIDGYSQAGTSQATASTPAALMIEIDGSNVTNNNGFNITSENNVISGLIINNFGLYGIAIYGSGATGNHIWGNVIGTDGSDTTGIGNGGGIGIGDAAHDNTIGGSTYGQRNVISGNALNGVDVMPLPGVVAYDNTISGNYIGTNNLGNAALGNGGSGLYIARGTYGNVVGGTTAQARNVISGNTADGIVIYNPLTNTNSITGNYIGTTKSGYAAIPNGTNGISIYGGAHDNIVGGDTSAERNLISGNTANGVRLYGVNTNQNQIAGNYIGVNVDGTAALPNGSSGVIVTEGASENIIGGSVSGEGNTISGNSLYGVYITDGSDLPEYPTLNIVIGNKIGTSHNGTAAVPNGEDGVRIDGGATNNIIGGTTALERNILSGNTYGGLVINGSGTSGNSAIGNYIGVAANGLTALPNASVGVTIWGGAHHNTIGGDTAAERNIISGNLGFGVSIQNSGTDANTLSGNYIGLDSSGSTAVPNGYSGIRITGGAQSNVIGGDAAGKGNVISANGHAGIELDYAGTDSNVISGNLIGTDHTGLLARGNTRYGIDIVNTASGTVIGGDTTLERNVICANGDGGIHIYDTDTDGTVIAGNYIGVGSDGLTAIPNGSTGIWVENGPSDTTIGGSLTAERNVIAAHPGSQIALTGTGTDNSVIMGNYIGIGSDGATDLTPAGSGVYLSTGVHNVTVGGTTPGERNVISGNGDGVVLNGSGNYGNTVIGNYIGTDASGSSAVGNNFNGVLVENGSSDNEIGGDLPGEGNLISGNGQYGIYITGAVSSGNVIQGNLIGSDALGMDAIPNNYDGVMLTNGTINNTIGGATAGSRNIISGNTLDGIEIQSTDTNGNVVRGNWIGVDATGWGDLGNGEYGVLVGGVINDATLGPDNRIAYNGLGGVFIFGADTEGVVITQNSIFQNAYDGIVLTSNGNNNIPAPSITSTSMSSVLIEGTACSGCTVEVFTNYAGEDQGRTHIGSTTADGSGDWSLTVACIGSPYLTATATDAADGTSEFSSVFTSSVRCIFMPLIMR